jgi:16S rRNA processing protein RimM
MINIGRITTAQGILGEVRVFPLTDFPDRFSQLKQVYINQDGNLVLHQVEAARSHNQYILLKLQEICSRDQAETLRNAMIQIPESELMPLPEGHYYLFQIVGLSVYAVNGDYLGKVKDVFRTGSNDVYQVVNDNRKDLLVPALREVVERIDLTEQRIIIRPLPGLLEI